MAIFPSYFFRQYRPGKCLLRYSRTTKTQFQAIKKRRSKSKKIDIFFKGVNPCLWSKNGHFSNFFFQALLGRKMSFRIFQNEKTPFQPMKTRSLKSRKWPFFPKGLIHGFNPKMAIFPTVFLSAVQARKMSFMMFQNVKSPFQAIETRILKSRKIDIFPKWLTHGFGPKMVIFPFFYQVIQTSKISFTIFQNDKNAILGYRNKKFKKSKI